MSEQKPSDRAVALAQDIASIHKPSELVAVIAAAIQEAIDAETERCAQVADARYERMTKRADGDAVACDAEATEPVRMLTREFWERISTARAREALKVASAIRSCLAGKGGR